jgi:hypothetical protein
MAPKIRHQPVVHEFGGEKGHNPDSERGRQDKSQRRLLHPKPSAI